MVLDWRARRGLGHGVAALVRGRLRLGRSYRRMLLADAREQAEDRVRREVMQLERTVQRDLSGFPHLHRQLSERIHRLEEDYRQSEEAPPRPPEWVHALETVANLPRPEDPSVTRLLEDMHGTLDRACHETLQSYRAASRRRHRIFRRMVPVWRRVERTLGTIQADLQRVEGRAAAVHRQIERFQRLSTREPDRARRAAGLTLARWVTAMLLLAAAAAGAVILHGLVGRSLVEVGAGLGSAPGGAPFSSWLTTALLAMIVTCGLLLTETARVTRLIPGLGNARTAIRLAFGIGAGVLLAVLAVSVAALALLRDYLLTLDAAADALYTRGSGAPLEPVLLWIPAVAQAVLAFGLALFLAVVPTAFEQTVRQGRLAMLASGIAILRATELALRLLALVTGGLSRLLLALYDLVVFAPLFIERSLRRRRDLPDAARGESG